MPGRTMLKGEDLPIHTCTTHQCTMASSPGCRTSRSVIGCNLVEPRKRPATSKNREEIVSFPAPRRRKGRQEYVMREGESTYKGIRRRIPRLHHVRNAQRTTRNPFWQYLLRERIGMIRPVLVASNGASWITSIRPGCVVGVTAELESEGPAGWEEGDGAVFRDGGAGSWTSEPLAGSRGGQGSR